jgi:hypothetical protein
MHDFHVATFHGLTFQQLFKVYLAIDAAVKKWSMLVCNWRGALSRFMIEFPECMPETL